MVPIDALFCGGGGGGDDDDDDSDNDFSRTDKGWGRRRWRDTASADAARGDIGKPCAPRVAESGQAGAPARPAEGPPPGDSASPTYSDYSTTAPRSPGEKGGLDDADVEDAVCSSHKAVVESNDATSSHSDYDDPMVPPRCPPAMPDWTNGEVLGIPRELGQAGALSPDSGITGKGTIRASEKMWWPGRDSAGPVLRPAANYNCYFGDIPEDQHEQQQQQRQYYLHHYHHHHHLYHPPVAHNHSTGALERHSAAPLLSRCTSEEPNGNNISDSAESSDLSVTELSDYNVPAKGPNSLQAAADAAPSLTRDDSARLPWWIRNVRAFAVSLGWRKVTNDVTSATVEPTDDREVSTAQGCASYASNGCKADTSNDNEGVAKKESCGGRIVESIGPLSSAGSRRDSPARHRHEANTPGAALISSAEASAASGRSPAAGRCRSRRKQPNHNFWDMELDPFGANVAGAEVCMRQPPHCNVDRHRSTSHCCPWDARPFSAPCGCGSARQAPLDHSTLDTWSFGGNCCRLRATDGSSSSASLPTQQQLDQQRNSLERQLQPHQGVVTPYHAPRRDRSPAACLVNFSFWRSTVNVALLLIGLYLVVFFITSLRHDVLNKAHQAARNEAQKALECQMQYERNKCDPSSRVPALDELCSQWELCLTNTANSFNTRYARFSAEVLGDSFNSFLEQFTWHSKASLIVGAAILLWSFR